jgi:hypothetical protein
MELNIMEIIMSLNNYHGAMVIGTIDNQFIDTWHRAWSNWHSSTNYSSECYNPIAWKKKFKSTVILYPKNAPADQRNDWAAIKFKNEGEYFLFMLEWA